MVGISPTMGACRGGSYGDLLDLDRQAGRAVACGPDEVTSSFASPA